MREHNELLASFGPESYAPVSMRLVVNGETRQVDGTPTVRELLVMLGFGDALVAVERNHEIVPRAAHPQTPLTDGDELEIVHFVGGG